ncbi:MAG: recombinase family protein, partial [Cyanobacteria bacterium J083]
MKNRWIIGGSCTGKTEKLVQALQFWLEQKKQIKKSNFSTDKSSLLILAANNTNRQALVERLAAASGGAYPVVCKTPLGFIMDEVKLFWPILFDLLELKAQFPLLLRPETEQDLATHLWREEADWEVLIQSEGEYKFVRQTLDLLQLAGAAGIAPKDIAYMLETGMPERDSQLELVLTSSIAQRRGEILLKWRKWCLERGLLTYGIILELYWRYLLPHPSYQNHLINRYAGILADDLDNYPAIMKDL